MALKRYFITLMSGNTNQYIFDADKISFMLSNTIHFDSQQMMTLTFDNYTHRDHWLDENILVPASECHCESTL